MPTLVLARVWEPYDYRMPWIPQVLSAGKNIRQFTAGSSGGLRLYLDGEKEGAKEWRHLRDFPITVYGNDNIHYSSTCEHR
jgi:hypothetical protein